MADWVSSPVAASENSNSRKQRLDERQLWRTVTGRNGSERELALSSFIAVKPPLEFGFPEADLGHWVLATQSGNWQRW